MRQERTLAMLHKVMWGIGPAIAFILPIAVGAGFFLWRRNLVANIVAHVIVDFVALVIGAGVGGR